MSEAKAKTGDNGRASACLKGSPPMACNSRDHAWSEAAKLRLTEPWENDAGQAPSARMTYHRRRTAWHLASSRYLLASFLLIFAAAAIYGCWNTAKAHGEAAWIMQSDETRWCCGPKDCAQLPDSDVTPLGTSAWRVNSTGQVFRQGDRGVYPSKRAGFWACRRPEGFVCFFYDGGAT